jgi:hypothetical protein
MFWYFSVGQAATLPFPLRHAGPLSAVAGLRASGAEREVVPIGAVRAERVAARPQPAAGLASILICTPVNPFTWTLVR